MMSANKLHVKDINQLWCQYYQWKPGNFKQLSLEFQYAINILNYSFIYFGHFYEILKLIKIQLWQTFLNQFLD